MKKGSFSLLLFVLLLSGAMVSCSNNTAAEADQQEETTKNNNGTAVQTAVKEEVEEVTGVQVGDKAPAFNLMNIDGEMYSFDNIMDANGETPKGFVVIFTCNTCPWAVGYEDRIIELHNTTSPMGYPVVAIQPNDPELKPGDSFEEMKVRAEEKGFPFLYLLDEGQEVYPQYGAGRTPRGIPGR